MKELFFDPTFSNSMLDLVSRLSNLSVSLYLETGIDRDMSSNIMHQGYLQIDSQSGLILSSSKTYFYISDIGLPEFCKKIRTDIPGVCDLLIPPGKEGIFRCKAGLWCRLVRFNLSDGIAYFNIGHRRIEGRDKQSWEKINELLEVNNLICRDYPNRLEGLFNDIPIVKGADYYKDIFQQLDVIQNHILASYNLIQKEREISYRYKSLIQNSAHQLLLPMQAIIALADNLSNDPILIDYPRLKKWSERIFVETINISHIAENLREIMVGGSDNKTVNMEHINIVALTNKIIKIFRKDAVLKGIEIRDLVLNTTQLMICGSEGDLTHMLYNLYNNAVKYTSVSEDGQVRYISTYVSKINGMCCIEITNYGIGILDDELEKICDYEFRGLLAKEHCRDGCGLGLPAVKSIINIHGGKIEFESRKIGDKAPLNSQYKTSAKVYLPYAIKR